MPRDADLGRPLGLGFVVVAGDGESTSGVDRNDRPGDLDGESEGGGKLEG